MGRLISEKGEYRTWNWEAATEEEAGPFKQGCRFAPPPLSPSAACIGRIKQLELGDIDGRTEPPIFQWRHRPIVSLRYRIAASALRKVREKSKQACEKPAGLANQTWCVSREKNR